MRHGEEMFGPYRLLGLLGRGGMGEVHRAADTRKRDRLVALKRLPAHLAGAEEFRARFWREAEIAAGLNEPHVIPIHDYGQIDGQLFIDMRLVRGADLATVLAEQGPLDAERAVEIVSQVARALDAAHEAGLWHRDVKPSNVLLADDGGERVTPFVYLVDFGLARAAVANGLTGTGAVLGSPPYMAPEQFTSGEASHLVDVYGLGCLLYESLTGQQPFGPDNLLGQMYAHLHRPPPRPSARRPDVPDGLDDVVTRAMAKRPGSRYPHAGHLAAAARAALLAASARRGPAHGGAPHAGVPTMIRSDPQATTGAGVAQAAQQVPPVGETQGDISVARALYQRAIQSGHVDEAPRALVRLGLLLQDEGDAVGARQCYEQVIASGHAGCAPAAVHNLAGLLWMQGDAAGARRLYEQLIATAHAELAPRAMLNLGKLLDSQADVGGARRFYEQAIASGHNEWGPRAMNLLALLVTNPPDPGF